MRKPQRRIPLLDLNAQHSAIREEILGAVMRVVDSGQVILGEDVRLLEREIAAYCGAAHAVGCGSGSDALLLALQALGVGPGDAVITTPFTFFATAGSISRAGARPVFADIAPATFNMDPDRLAAALAAHPEAKAVIPVHLFGGCADMDPILALARERGCAVIEDGAQAIGAEYKGRRALGLGDAGCLSFFPSKNLGGIGEGGMVTTNREEIAARVAALRVHGSREPYRHEWIGTNSRLDTIQAAVLRVKLRHLDAWTQARQRNAARYRELLGGAGIPVKLPAPAPYQTRHVHNQFVIRCRDRDRLKAYLGEQGVGTQIYYPIPLHLQPCYGFLGYREGEFPASEQAAREVLALPVHAHLPEDDVAYICELIRLFYAGG